MAMSEWENLSRMILQATERKAAAAAREMNAIGEEVLAQSRDLCPTSPTNPTTPGVRKKRIKNPFYTGHPGQLRASGTADPVERSSTLIRKVVKYTDKIAAAVHERLQPAHGAALKAKHPGVQFNSINDEGQWKFLAVPVIQMRDKVTPRIGEAMNRA